MQHRDWNVSCVGKYVAQGLECVLCRKICSTWTGMCPAEGKYVAQGLECVLCRKICGTGTGLCSA
jgi:hypothetical protein